MAQNTPPFSAAASSIVNPALDNLAARVRAGGLFLMMLSPGEGQSVVYHDQAARPFFTQYVLPLLRQAQLNSANPLREELRRIDGASAVTILSGVPGALLAAFPFVDRRHLAGICVLAAKPGDFKTDEAVVARCVQLGLSEQWLADQAVHIPAHTSDSVRREGQMLLTMARDQVQLGTLQSELDSLSNQLSNTYEELSLIYQISSGMRINRQASDFFKKACLDVLEVMEVLGMGVVLFGEHAARQQPVVYGQLKLQPAVVQRLADVLTPLVKSRGGPLLLNDSANQPGFAWLEGRVQRVLAVPMQRQDEMLGYYFAVDKLEGEFDSQDSKLLSSIANESAIFLENAMLYDDVHGLMMGLLHSLTSAVDAKDAYTLGHSERVAAVGRQLAFEAGMDEAFADRVYLAGLLHDVGKIGVPEAVLHKTGRLTPEEFEHMKKHPQIGARILADVKQIRDLIPGVLHHHERYDGNGYPHNLAGENIPIMGRLICLADCFDAMTSNRTYRKALPLEVALTEIRRCSGTQFDPKLTEAFLRIGAAKLRELILPAPKPAEGEGNSSLAAISLVPPQVAA